MKKRYYLILVDNKYLKGEIRGTKPLTEYEKSKRTNREFYFKNGRSKTSKMKCHSKGYRKEINPFPGFQCAGSSCYFYPHGCDSQGIEWQ